MGHSDGYRTSLTMPKGIDYERVKKRGFHDDGIVVANLNDDRLDQFERQFLTNIGEKLYGKRRKPE